MIAKVGATAARAAGGAVKSWFLGGVARTAAGVAGFVINPAVRKMIASKALSTTTGRVVTGTAALGLLAGGIYAYNSQEGPSGPKLSDGRPVPAHTKEQLEAAAAAAGITEDTPITVANMAKFAVAARSIGIPEEWVAAAEAAIRAEFMRQSNAETYAAASLEPDAYAGFDEIEVARGRGAFPPAASGTEQGHTELAALAAAARRLCSMLGVPMSKLPSFLDDLQTVASASRDSVDTIVELQRVGSGW